MSVLSCCIVDIRQTCFGQVAALAGDKDRLLADSFYALSEFRVHTASQAIAYPRSCLLSHSYAPQLHRADQARRLKNVEVIND